MRAWYRVTFLASYIKLQEVQTFALDEKYMLHFLYNFFWNTVRIKMTIIPTNVWIHSRILEHYCLVLFIWGLFIVFCSSPFCSPNIVFLLGLERWMCHRLNNGPVNVVSWMDYSPSSYQLDPIFRISTTANLTIYKRGRHPCIFTVYFLSLGLISKMILSEWHWISCTLTLCFCVLSFWTHIYSTQIR